VRSNTLREVLSHRPARWKWAYAPPLLVLALFIAFGAHEGAWAIGHLLLLACICTLQLFYGTILGWGILTAFFVWYSGAVVFAHEPSPEGASFVLLGAIPIVSLYFARPMVAAWTDWGLAMATVVVGVLFFWSIFA
jgi:hypothetical protein